MPFNFYFSIKRLAVIGGNSAWLIQALDKQIDMASNTMRYLFKMEHDYSDS